jgi:hypothetical protein
LHPKGVQWGRSAAETAVQHVALDLSDETLTPSELTYVDLIDEMRLNAADIQVRRHEIVGHVGVHGVARPVAHCLF